MFLGSVPTNWLGNVPTPEKDPVVAEKPSQRSLAPVSSRNITLEIISPSRSGSVASSDPMTSPPPESKHHSLLTVRTEALGQQEAPVQIQLLSTEKSKFLAAVLNKRRSP